MNIIIASDHGGFEIKQQLIEHYKNLIDLGCYSDEMCDFPDYAKKMVESISKDEAQLGIAICGTGIGMSIALNRHKGIRATILYDDFSAVSAKEHNNANIIVFGGRTMSFEQIKTRIDLFLNAQFIGGRYQKRINKTEEL